MRRTVLVLGLAMLPLSSALAAEGCGVYTLDTRPPGEKVARIVEDRDLTIEEQGAKPKTYELRSAGTGIAAMEGHPTGKTGGELIEVLEFRGGLVVDMQPFEPFCKP